MCHQDQEIDEETITAMMEIMKEMISEISMAIMAAIIVNVVRIEYGKWVQRRLDRKYEKMKELKRQ